MSLLLDALKKAEKAKDDAKRRAQPGVDPEETVLQVRTRNELPDISAPLEIHAEDVPGKAPQAESLSLVPDAYPTATASGKPADPPPVEPPAASSPVPEEPPRRKPVSREQSAAPDPVAGQRAAAKKVFEAKFREPNPKLPFYITMAFLGVFALGTVIYFWYQLRPPPPLVNTGAKPPPDEKKVVDLPKDSGPAATGASAAPQAPAIPGLPQQAAAAPEPATPAAAPPGPAASATPPQVAATAPPSRAAAAPKPAAAAPAAPAAPAPPVERAPPRRSQSASDASKLSVHRAAPVVNPKLEAGWLAYNQGDLTAARANYEEVVRAEPTNRDALLGMAALEVRANRPAEAEVYYQRLLEINPRDPHAQAGILALRAHMTDPVQAESRVKSLLATDPEAHVLYFTLGNEYAQQQRWPEAQQAYFKAFSADPENPDFAYNLAVSLDHVRKPKLALEYYRRAISLAQQRSSNFDQNLARNRAQELAR